MKTKSPLVQWIALLALPILQLQLATVFAQPTTAFTYQGQLTENGSPLTGTYDLTFTLYSASSGGSLITGPVTNSPVAVSGGLFTVTLDFGNQFPGADRWLEIASRTNGVGAFAPLTPRQQITSTPYAITALNAANFSGNVGSSQITDGAVATADLADNSVTSAKIVNGTIASGDLANGAVGTSQLADGSVTGLKILDGSVINADLAAGAVNSASILDATIATADLADNSVTSAKIIDGSVSNSDLAADAVNSANIVNASVANTDLAPNAVTSTKIQDGTVVTADLGDDSVTSAKVLDAAILGADLADNTVTSTQLADSIGFGSATVPGNLDVFDGGQAKAVIALNGTNRTVQVRHSSGTNNVTLSANNYGGRFESLDENQVQTAVLGSSTVAGGFLQINQANTTVLGINLDGDATGARGGGALAVYNTNGSITVALSGAVGTSNRGQVKTEDLVMTTTGTTNLLAALATLSPTTGYVKVGGNGASVTLNATTAIASGPTAGSILIMEGTHDVNTVIVPDSGNMRLAANRTLGGSDTLTLIWNGSAWVELSFSNN